MVFEDDVVSFVYTDMLSVKANDPVYCLYLNSIDVGIYDRKSLTPKEKVQNIKILLFINRKYLIYTYFIIIIVCGKKKTKVLIS